MSAVTQQASPEARSARPVRIVAIEMGFGHMRAATSLADALDAEVLEIDRAPLAGEDERRRWERLRQGYEFISRASQRTLGRPLRRVLEAVTAIPALYPARDFTSATLPVVLLERAARHGLGRGLVNELRAHEAALVTTFFAPAVIADAAGLSRVFCIVTDSDINRVWAAREAAASSIVYCVPSNRAARRLQSFGVRPERIHVTGFPLPLELLGGPGLEVLKRNLAARLVRLDPKSAFREDLREELSVFLGPLPEEEEHRPPLLTFAVGGAGAQYELARAFLPALRPAVAQGRLRVALVAGLRVEIAREFERLVQDLGLRGPRADAVTVLHAASFPEYYRRFNALLAGTDILWTKPSELTFYGALGIPLVFSRPVGMHERANRKWARQRGAGFKMEDPAYAWDWMREWLHDGTLAAAAWSGYMRMPKFGSFRIPEVIGGTPR